MASGTVVVVIGATVAIVAALLAKGFFNRGRDAAAGRPTNRPGADGDSGYAPDTGSATLLPGAGATPASHTHPRGHHHHHHDDHPHHPDHHYHDTGDADHSSDVGGDFGGGDSGGDGGGGDSGGGDGGGGGD